VVGLLLCLFQAINQLKEQTLSFGVKLFAVCINLFLSAGWFGGELLRFGREIFDRFYLIL
jgi:type III secretion protein S